MENVPRPLDPGVLIILAAGRSSRMGIPKGLMELEGDPWLEAQLAGAARAGVREVLIVLGFQREAYFAALPWLEAARDAWTPHQGLRVRSVLNPDPDRGQFSSLQTGLAALVAPDGGAPRGAFVLPVDVPCPERSVWESLAGALTGPVEVCVPEWRGKGGHPVLLARAFIEKLVALPAESRLDERIHALPSAAYARRKVEEPRIAVDLNSPEDVARFRRGAR